MAEEKKPTGQEKKEASSKAAGTAKDRVQQKLHPHRKQQERQLQKHRLRPVQRVRNNQHKKQSR